MPSNKKCVNQLYTIYSVMLKEIHKFSCLTSHLGSKATVQRRNVTLITKRVPLLLFLFSLGGRSKMALSRGKALVQLALQRIAASNNLGK